VRLTTTLSLALLLVACGRSPTAQPAPSSTPEATREAVVHVHVPDKVAEGTGRFKADWSFDLVTGSSWSAHVHVIPQDQLVPAHRHVGNDELVFIAAGEGLWMGHHYEEGGAFAPTGPGSEAMGVGFTRPGVRSPSWEVATGDAVVSVAGAVHAVRNREAAPLATVVVQRPEFGQNWYLLPDEVRSGERTRAFLPDSRTPRPPDGRGPVRPHDPVFDGWSLDWLEAAPGDVAAEPAETLYLAAGGDGTLSFEDKALPLRAGTFVKIPPSLPHRIDPGADPLELLRVRIPR
jgi:mannose-6-phosphate isomerase-like protein (cupin superfamily)